MCVLVHSCGVECLENITYKKNIGGVPLGIGIVSADPDLSTEATHLVYVVSVESLPVSGRVIICRMGCNRIKLGWHRSERGREGWRARV